MDGESLRTIATAAPPNGGFRRDVRVEIPPFASGIAALSKSSFQALNNTPSHLADRKCSPVDSSRGFSLFQVGMSSRDLLRRGSGLPALEDNVPAQCAVDMGQSSLLGSGADAALSTSLRPLRILLVDDAAVNRRMLVRALRVALSPLEYGELEIEEASDGLDGLVAAGYSADSTAPVSAMSNFDVCLCDAEMPSMTGYEMVSALRARGCQLPIIGITGNTLPEDIERFISAGVHAVVTKPVRMPELLLELRKWVPAIADVAHRRR